LLVCDARDARDAETLRNNGLRVQCCQTIMRSASDRAELARTVLSLTTNILSSREPSSSKPGSEEAAARTLEKP
jgi:hypothetical protein